MNIDTIIGMLRYIAISYCSSSRLKPRGRISIINTKKRYYFMLISRFQQDPLDKSIDALHMQTIVTIIVSIFLMTFRVEKRRMQMQELEGRSWQRRMEKGKRHSAKVVLIIMRQSIIIIMKTYEQRLQKQYNDFHKTAQSANIKVSLVNNNITHWKGFINGPADTPYEGGLYQIDIVIPPDYPYKPPKMKFETKIWHPNISSQTGAICLDILKDQWSPALTIRTALLSLQALLCAPQPSDPQDAVVAGEYKSDKKTFIKHAKEWVQKYASPKINQAKVQKLMDMGFSKQKVEAALQKSGYEQQKALEELLSGV